MEATPIQQDQVKTKAGGGANILDQAMMAGVNHRTAAVQLREKLAIPKEMASSLPAALSEELGLKEVIALSTCNRTEIYWRCREHPSWREIFGMLPSLDETEVEQVAKSIYTRRGEDLVLHLFRLASGLDSMVVGETQVLGQIKAAYECSRELGFTGAVFNPLFQYAFQVAKQVHTGTRLATRQASVPAVAIGLAEAVFGDIEQTAVLVLGTGEIAGLTLDALRDRGASKFIFVSRSEDRASEWEASHGASAGTIDEIDQLLPGADIVITCTDCSAPVLGVDHFQRALEKRPQRGRPFLVLDLGLPRNVAPDVSRIESVFLRNIDDLQEVVQKNLERLATEQEKAENMVERAHATFCRQWRARSADGTIAEIREITESTAQEELERALRRLPELGPEGKEEIKLLVHRLVRKFLHHPSRALRDASADGLAADAVMWARRLFGLRDNDNREE